jgi:membrane-associated phospholipid phosphatase
MRPRAAVSLGFALLAAVGLIAALIPAEPLAIDQRWFEAMQSIQTPLLKDVARVFDALGRGIGIVLSLTALAGALALARRFLALLVFAAAETLAMLGSTVLKATIGRARPPHGVVETATTSFPSGHTTYAAATCVALVLLYSAPGPSRLWWWLLATLGIAGMAWSRTYLQMHWLSDVVTGALLGIGASLAVFGVAQVSMTARAPIEKAPSPRLSP